MPGWLFYLAAISLGLLPGLAGLAGLSPLLCLSVTTAVDVDEL